MAKTNVSKQLIREVFNYAKVHDKDISFAKIEVEQACKDKYSAAEYTDTYEYISDNYHNLCKLFVQGDTNLTTLEIE